MDSDTIGNKLLNVMEFILDDIIGRQPHSKAANTAVGHKATISEVRGAMSQPMQQPMVTNENVAPSVVQHSANE